VEGWTADPLEGGALSRLGSGLESSATSSSSSSSRSGPVTSQRPGGDDALDGLAPVCRVYSSYSSMRLGSPVLGAAQGGLCQAAG